MDERYLKMDTHAQNTGILIHADTTHTLMRAQAVRMEQEQALVQRGRRSQRQSRWNGTIGLLGRDVRG
jgi:hypothetical protein